MQLTCSVLVAIGHYATAFGIRGVARHGTVNDIHLASGKRYGSAVAVVEGIVIEGATFNSATRITNVGINVYTQGGTRLHSVVVIEAAVAQVIQRAIHAHARCFGGIGVVHVAVIQFEPALHNTQGSPARHGIGSLIAGPLALVIGTLKLEAVEGERLQRRIAHGVTIVGCIHALRAQTHIYQATGIARRCYAIGIKVAREDGRSGRWIGGPCGYRALCGVATTYKDVATVDALCHTASLKGGIIGTASKEEHVAVLILRVGLFLLGHGLVLVDIPNGEGLVP